MTSRTCTSSAASDGLDRNCYASGAEAILLREQISIDEAAIRSLQQSKRRVEEELEELEHAVGHVSEALNAVQSAYAGLLAQEDELVARISRARGHFHPLRKLPNEILGNIFLQWRDLCPECKSGPDNAPICDHVCLRSAAVCRWWRNVALNLYELWREVQVPLGRVSSRNADRWAARLDVHVTRSGPLPLDLDVYGDWTRVPPSARFWDALKRCFGRARFIAVYSEAARFTLNFLRCFYQDALYLREFRAEIWLSPGENHALRFFRSAPALKHFKLGVSLTPVWSPQQPAFANVTHANLDGINAHGLRDLFHHMPNISNLVVYATNLVRSNIPPDFLVRGVELKNLDWSFGAACDEYLVRRIQFPALDSAVLRFWDHEVVSDAVLTAFLRYPLRSVHHLTLERLETSVLAGLAHTRLVETLVFKDFTQTSQAALDAFARADSSGDWLCPRLTKLTLPAQDVWLSFPSLQETIVVLTRARGPHRVFDARLPGPAQLTNLDFASETGAYTSPFGELITHIVASSSGASI